MASKHLIQHRSRRGEHAPGMSREVSERTCANSPEIRFESADSQFDHHDNMLGGINFNGGCAVDPAYENVFPTHSLPPSVPIAPSGRGRSAAADFFLRVPTLRECKQAKERKRSRGRIIFHIFTPTRTPEWHSRRWRDYSGLRSALLAWRNQEGGVVPVRSPVETPRVG